jgi:hypothetical protein
MKDIYLPASDMREQTGLMMKTSFKVMTTAVPTMMPHPHKIAITDNARVRGLKSPKHGNFRLSNTL